jgi:serine/threonine-protein kinase
MPICPTCRRETEESTCPEDGTPTVDHTWLERRDDTLEVEAVVDDRYFLEAPLGHGAFADVYRARRLDDGRVVALKMLREARGESDLQVTRFQREAEALESLDHPNIVRVYHSGRTSEGRLFIEMECLEGDPLSDVLERKGALSPERTVRFAIATLDALRDVHARGVTHRDLAPNNLFVVESDGGETLKLIDFGIARVGGGEEQSLIDEGELLGSPRYMAPEQWKRESIDERADVYAVGAVFYRVLAGRPVFEKETLRAQLAAVLFEDPSPPEVDGARLEGPLVDVLMACLARDPDDRPGVEEALERLEACRHAPIANRSSDLALDVPSEPVPSLSIERDDEDNPLVFDNYTPEASDASEDDGEEFELLRDALDGGGGGALDGGSPTGTESTSGESNDDEPTRANILDSHPEVDEAAEESEDDEEDLATRIAFGSLLISIPLLFVGLGWLLFVDPETDRRPRRRIAPPSSGSTTAGASTGEPPSGDRGGSKGVPDAPDAGSSRSDGRGVRRLEGELDNSHPEGRKQYIEATQDWLRGRPRRALETCERALASGYEPCHKIIGLTHRDLGNKRKACKSLNKYLETDPADAESIRKRMASIGCST